MHSYISILMCFVLESTAICWGTICQSFQIALQAAPKSHAPNMVAHGLFKGGGISWNSIRHLYWSRTPFTLPACFPPILVLHSDSLFKIISRYSSKRIKSAQITVKSTWVDLSLIAHGSSTVQLFPIRTDQFWPSRWPPAWPLIRSNGPAKTIISAAKRIKL